MALFARFARWLPWQFVAFLCVFCHQGFAIAMARRTGIAPALWIPFEAMATPAL